MNNYHRVHDYEYMKKLVCPCCIDEDINSTRRMAGHSTKNRHEKTYLYYNCPNCGKYINEKDIEELLLYHLDDLYQFHSVLACHTNSFQLDIKDVNAARVHSDLDFVIANAKVSDYYDDINNLEFLKLTDEERRQFVDKYIDTIELCESINGNLNIKKISYKRHMIEIMKIFEDKGIIPQLHGERYERNMRQALSKEDFDKLVVQLSVNFDVHIEDSPLFPTLPITPNLLKIVEIKQKKAIFNKCHKYVCLAEPE